MDFLVHYESYKDELEQVDQLLLDRLSKAPTPVKKSTIQLINSGGKRTRPLLCLLGSCFGEPSQPKPYQIAAAIELIHMSSLIHDDIIDRASLRRGKPTIHNQFNNQHAIYIGDFLFAHSLEIMSSINNPLANQIFSFTINKLTIGELEQYKNRYRMNDSIKMYLKKNRNKTARMIGVSCRLGALFSNASHSIQDALYQFGYNLGMSYQIIDDILDFTEPEERLGKKSGQDLSEGYLTLPTILAMKETDLYESISQLFHQCLSNEPVNFKPIIDQIKQTKAIDLSYRISQYYIDRALKILKELPDVPVKSVMYQMVGYLSKRHF